MIKSEKYVVWATGVIVALLTFGLAFLAFGLSYDVLIAVAHSGGKPGLPGQLWPLLIDGPVIVFSALAFFAIVFGYSWATVWIFRLLIIAATILTVYFNGSYAQRLGYDPLVYLAAPLVYVAVFESAAWLIHAITRRIVVVDGIKTLQKRHFEAGRQAEAVEARGKALLQKLATEAGQKRQAIRQELAGLQAALESESGKLRAEIEAAKKALASYQEDTERVRWFIPVPPDLTIDQRRAMVWQLYQQPGWTQGRIAEAFGLSETTIKNDIAVYRDSKVKSNGHKVEA